MSPTGASLPKPRARLGEAEDEWPGDDDSGSKEVEVLQLPSTVASASATMALKLPALEVTPDCLGASASDAGQDEEVVTAEDLVATVQRALDSVQVSGILNLSYLEPVRV